MVGQASRRLRPSCLQRTWICLVGLALALQLAPIRAFASDSTNPDRYCVEQGYARSNTTNNHTYSDGSTLSASWDKTASKWVGSNATVQIGLLNTIACRR